MRERFTMKLAELNQQLIEMGSFVENAISNAKEALMTCDAKLAEKTIEEDRLINAKEREIESTCLKLILHEQPIARDLRLISSALKMITDMERIGDQATDISEIVLNMEDATYLTHLGKIPEMAEETIAMLNMSIDAYVKKDLDLARSVFFHDAKVNKLFVEIRDYLIKLIQEDQNNGAQAIDLIMIAKYMERIGDHAVNISEWVIFSLTGKHKNKRII